MAKKDSKTPVQGDDAGNLTKAGFKTLKEANALYETESKTNPAFKGVSFSDFLYEQAAVAFAIDNIIGEE
jgi:hypothetical protein